MTAALLETMAALNTSRVQTTEVESERCDSRRPGAKPGLDCGRIQVTCSFVVHGVVVAAEERLHNSNIRARRKWAPTVTLAVK